MRSKHATVTQIGVWLSLAACQGLCDSATLSEYRVNIPERGDVIGYVFAVQTNHFAFLPPPEWRVSCKPGTAEVVMLSPDSSSSMTIEFLEPPQAGKSGEGRAAAFLARRYPDCPVRETFRCRTGIGKARGFQLDRKAANDTRLATRVVYVARDWGTVEFTLTTPAAKLPERIAVFDNLINSFQRPADSFRRGSQEPAGPPR